MRKIIPIIFCVIFTLAMLIGCGENEQVTYSKPEIKSTITQAKTTEKVFVGSINSNKYHDPSCKWAEKIKPSNEIWFSSVDEAEEQGYIACKVCNP